MGKRIVDSALFHAVAGFVLFPVAIVFGIVHTFYLALRVESIVRKERREA
jgi:hypothetical protein